MAYTLAKITIREMKKDVPAGVNSYSLPSGVIPVDIPNYTKIAENTEPGIGEWSFFNKTKTLKINLLSLEAFVYVQYNLLVSNKPIAHYALDPVTNTGTKYVWQPYLQNSPVVVESSKDILEGIISYNNINLVIQSTDQENIRDFLGSKFSIDNQPFKMWRIKNNGAVVPVYTGVGKSVSYSDTSVNLGFNPSIKGLDSEATYGIARYQNPSETPLHVCAVTPHSWSLLDGLSVTGLGVCPVMGFAPENMVKLDYNYSTGNTLTLYSGITRGSYSNSNYSNYPTTPVLGNSNRFSAYMYLEYYSNFNLGTSSVDFPNGGFAQNFYGPMTGIINYNQYTCVDTIFTFVEPIIDGYGPVLLKQSDGTNIYYCSVGKATSTNLGNNTIRYNYFGYGNNGIGSVPQYSGDNVISVSYEKKFYLCARVKSGADTGASQQIENTAFLLMPDQYTVNTLNSSVAGTNIKEYQFSVDLTKVREMLSFVNTAGQGQKNLINKRVEFFLYYDKTSSENSLSMKDFVSDTLKCAGFTPDLSAVDFDAIMQLSRNNLTTYRDILESLFSSVGLFLRFDHTSETVEVIKIDDTASPHRAFNENDFSSLRISLNSNDTYNKVIFKNPHAFEGKETEAALAGYDYLVEEYATNSLNQKENVKTIEMPIMDNPRTGVVSQAAFDSKYNYSFKFPNDDEYSAVRVGDWLYLESTKIPEPTNQAKILITKVSTGETDISVEGIKFASID